MLKSAIETFQCYGAVRMSNTVYGDGINRDITYFWDHAGNEVGYYIAYVDRYHIISRKWSDESLKSQRFVDFPA